MFKKYLFVKISQPSFEYDVNSIVKAFYPDRQVKVLTDESVSLWEEYRTLTAEEASKGEIEEIEIHLEESGARMILHSAGKNPNGAGREYVWNTDAGSLAQAPDAYKAGFKSFLYKTLEDYVGKSLPWGNLTGIRPTKIAFGLLEEGKTPYFKPFVSLAFSLFRNGVLSLRSGIFCFKQEGIIEK